MLKNLQSKLGVGDRQAPALVLAVLLLLGLGGLAWRTWLGAPPSQPVGLVMAVNTGYVASCPILAAQRYGYFLAQGVQISIQSHTSGKSAMEAVLTGAADLGTVADIPIVFAALEHAPISVVATFFQAETDHGIVARRDHGIQRPQDLKGKRIGATQGTSGHFILDAFLNKQRLRPSEVSMRNFKPEDLTAALQRGEVDAIASWEPYLEQTMRLLKENGIAFYGQNIYEITYNMAGRTDYIKAHPERIVKVLRALEQGEQFCRLQTDRAQAMMAQETQTELGTMKKFWSSYRFDMRLDQGLILALEDETRWVIKNRLSSTTVMPNFLDSLYLDGLDSVSPEAVSVIH
ncbi:MAG: NrtA/SsuA/CpmA family ABC transporter substrate-binding protein [Curvibacter sp.]|nr:NrtA/SsuA/CpmA family ABC transporter substrate-binding protein [Curvibacter sp.]